MVVWLLDRLFLCGGFGVGLLLRFDLLLVCYVCVVLLLAGLGVCVLI